MVVFRIKGENELTEKLLKRLNNRGNMHAVPASLKGKYVIRFTVTSTRTSNEDILKDWNEIRFVTTELLTELGVKVGERAKVSLKGKSSVSHTSETGTWHLFRTFPQEPHEHTCKYCKYILFQTRVRKTKHLDRHCCSPTHQCLPKLLMGPSRPSLTLTSFWPKRMLASEFL